MREPSHSDPNNHCDHPLDFCERHAWDVYLNPWFALRFLNGPPETLANEMTRVLGKPTLVAPDSGWTTRLEWPGRRVMFGGSLGPQILANLSGGNGSIWTTMYLPWGNLTFKDIQSGWHPEALGHNMGGHDLNWHLDQLYEYAGIARPILENSGARLRTEKFWAIGKTFSMERTGTYVINLKDNPQPEEEVIP